MSEQVVTLKPKAMVEADLIRADAERLLDYVRARDCVAMAVCLVHADNTTAVQKRGSGCRTMLLGAVADLQFSIASDGDA